MASCDPKYSNVKVIKIIKSEPPEPPEPADPADPFDQFYTQCDETSAHNNHNYDEFDVPGYQQIKIDMDPPSGKWKLPPLYKVGARGEDRYYQIGFDGKNVVTKHGQVGGEIQTFRKQVELNTSGRNISQQAMVNAANLFRKYYRQNYREQGSAIPVVTQPMCGHPLKDAKNLTFPVALEVKLNGVRGLFEMNDSGEIQVRSRGNKFYTQFENICSYMKDLFMYLPRGTILDAEIYNENLNLEDISGTARTINFKAELAPNLIAYVFDAVLPFEPVYEDRKEFIQRVYNKYLDEFNYEAGIVPIEIVPYKVVSSMEEIYDFHKWSRGEGYEGTVIKRMSAGTANKAMCQYKGGKSGRFYKLKDVFDEEGIILEVLDCIGKESGCARFRVIDPRGNIFTIRPKGDYEYRKELYQKGSELIGQLFTYECSGLTKYGVPEHPRGVAIRYDLDTETIVNDMVSELATKGICLCQYLSGECDACYKPIAQVQQGMEQLNVS